MTEICGGAWKRGPDFQGRAPRLFCDVLEAEVQSELHLAHRRRCICDLAGA